MGYSLGPICLHDHWMFQFKFQLKFNVRTSIYCFDELSSNHWLKFYIVHFVVCQSNSRFDAVLPTLIRISATHKNKLSKRLELFLSQMSSLSRYTIQHLLIDRQRRNSNQWLPGLPSEQLLREMLSIV